MLFKSRRNEYVDTEGPVRYLDGSGLERPLDIPKPQIAVMIAFVVVAALIGGYLLFNILDTEKGGAARAQASGGEPVARGGSRPAGVTSYIALSDRNKQAAHAGLTVIDKGGMSDDPDAALELIKLPSDVSELDAGLLYSKGVSKLTASEAALLLNGSWTLDADRTDGLSMSLHYADFSSGSLDAAIDSAIAGGPPPPSPKTAPWMRWDVQAGRRGERDHLHLEGVGHPAVRTYDISACPKPPPTWRAPGGSRPAATSIGKPPLSCPSMRGASFFLVNIILLKNSPAPQRFPRAPSDIPR